MNYEEIKSFLLNLVSEARKDYHESQYLKHCGSCMVDRRMKDNYCIKGINFVIQDSNTILYFPVYLEDQYLNWIEGRKDMLCMDESCAVFTEETEMPLFISALEEMVHFLR